MFELFLFWHPTCTCYKQSPSWHSPDRWFVLSHHQGIKLEPSRKSTCCWLIPGNLSIKDQVLKRERSNIKHVSFKGCCTDMYIHTHIPVPHMHKLNFDTSNCSILHYLFHIISVMLLTCMHWHHQSVLRITSELIIIRYKSESFSVEIDYFYFLMNNDYLYIYII